MIFSRHWWIFLHKICHKCLLLYWDVPFIPTFIRVFIMNGCYILSNAFSCIYWDDHVGLCHWLMLCIILIDLCMLNHSCEPGVNWTWPWCMNFSVLCWIWFASVLLIHFASMFIKDNCLQFSFIGIVFVWFWYQSDGDLIEWLWESVFWKNLRRIGVSSSLYVW